MFEQYLPVRTLQLLFLFLMPLAAYATFRRPRLSIAAIVFVAAWFFAFKLTEQAASRRPPMDISAICYLLFVACAVVPVRPARVAVGQISALCGLVYGLVMLIAPQIFFARDSYGTVVYTLTNHSLLLFGGLTMMGRAPFKKTDLFWTLGLLGAVIAYIEINTALGVAAGNAVFSQIVDGSIMQVAVPGFAPQWWYYFLYYPVVFSALGLWIALTYAINRRATEKESRSGALAV